MLRTRGQTLAKVLSLFSINVAGAVTGGYVDVNGLVHGFLRFP
jgi:hypothetical protein